MKKTSSKISLTAGMQRLYGKTWKGKTIITKIDLNHTVKSMKEQIEEMTKIPKEH